MFAAWGLGAVVHFNTYFGEGTAGSIFLDNMQCLGNEFRLVNCPNTALPITTLPTYMSERVQNHGIQIVTYIHVTHVRYHCKAVIIPIMLCNIPF